MRAFDGYTPRMHLAAIFEAIHRAPIDDDSAALSASLGSIPVGRTLVRLPGLAVVALWSPNRRVSTPVELPLLLLWEDLEGVGDLVGRARSFGQDTNIPLTNRLEQLFAEQRDAYSQGLDVLRNANSIDGSPAFTTTADDFFAAPTVRTIAAPSPDRTPGLFTLGSGGSIVVGRTPESAAADALHAVPLSGEKAREVRGDLVALTRAAAYTSYVEELAPGEDLLYRLASGIAIPGEGRAAGGEDGADVGNDGGDYGGGGDHDDGGDNGDGGHEPPPGGGEVVGEADGDEADWLNVEIEERAEGAPIRVGEWQTLTLFVGRKASGALGAEKVGDLLPEGETVEFLVQVSGSGVTVDGGGRVLPVRRGEPRPKRVRFDFRPEQAECELVAVISRERSVCVTATIRIRCDQEGVEPEVTFARRPWAAAVQTPRRDIGLVITQDGDRIRCTYSDEDYQDSGLLGIDRTTLVNRCGPLFEEVDRLMQVISGDSAFRGDPQGVDAVSVFGLDQRTLGSVAQKKATRSRRQVALTGLGLFSSLFMQAADDGARRIGARLRAKALGEHSLRIQVLTKAPVHVPWAFLYLGPTLNRRDSGDWNRFLGTNHLLEEISEELLDGVDRSFATADKFTVSFSGYNQDPPDEVANAALAQRMHVEALVSRMPGGVIRHTSDCDGAYEALTERPGDLVYLFCHGEARGPLARGGQEASNVRFGPEQDDVLTLAELSAATEEAYGIAPLVVVNACQVGRRSADDGMDLVSYFLRRRARGVIAASAYVPVSFGAAWAIGFFDRLLAGDELGPTLRALSDRALEVWGVPLGLLYTANCALETRLPERFRVAS